MPWVRIPLKPTIFSGLNLQLLKLQLQLRWSNLLFRLLVYYYAQFLFYPPRDQTTRVDSSERGKKNVLKVHMNRKFFLCRYKLSPLKYTISKFETFGVKIGDVTGVQSYAFCPEKWSSNREAKRPKCHVM